MRTEKQIDIAKRAQTARLGQSGAEGKRKRCRKGKSCGASCISSSKFCLVDLPWVSSSLASTRNQIVNRPRPATPAPKPAKQPEKPDNRKVSEKLKKALPKFKVTVYPSFLSLSQEIDGYKLEINFSSDRSILFTVNNKLIAPSGIPEKTGIKIAYQVKVAAREFFKTMPDGATFEVSAATSDGKGEKRVKAYERIGFSSPSYVGGSQAGIVRGGKLFPISVGEFDADMTTLEFSERDDLRETIAWFTVLYGREPKLSAASLSNLD